MWATRGQRRKRDLGGGEGELTLHQSEKRRTPRREGGDPSHTPRVPRTRKHRVPKGGRTASRTKRRRSASFRHSREIVGDLLQKGEKRDVHVARTKSLSDGERPISKLSPEAFLGGKLPPLPEKKRLLRIFLVLSAPRKDHRETALLMKGGAQAPESEKKKEGGVKGRRSADKKVTRKGRQIRAR